ncbi:MAG: NAD(P)/FAD-dependent oxidoreductase [Candidatus Hermodarchaeia archaeon]
MTEKFDIIVIGAGILGVASAYYLQKNNPDKTILLVDSQPDAGQANTAMSAAAIRNMFSSSTNQLLTDTSIDFFRHIQEDLKFDLTLHFCGYLWLLSNQQFNEPSVQSWMQRMEANDIAYRTIEKPELKKLLPGLVTEFPNDEEANIMNLNPVDYALFGAECGVLDPSLLVQFYKDEFLKLTKVKPRYNLTVHQLLLEAEPPLGLPGEPYVWQNKQVTGIRSSQGIIQAEKVVLAVGPWTNALLDPVGIPSYVKAKKRQLFIVAASDQPSLEELLFAKGFSDTGFIPFTILPSGGVYLRGVPEEKSFWVGCADKVGRAYKYNMDDDDYNAERTYYEQSIYPVLNKYFPAFANLRPTNMWAGAYSYSVDAIPLVYEHSGVIVVTGASGSGIMKADAIARMADALYRGETDTELHGGRTIPTTSLGLTHRKVERENVLI